MINSKADYKFYLECDELAFGVSTKGFKNKLAARAKLFFYSEKFVLLHYTKLLRKLEYLNNIKGTKSLAYLFTYRKYRKLSIKLQINIPVNTVKEGLLILHLGTIIVNSGAKIGKNCILQPGVIIGQKDSAENVPVIADNVYFGPGSMVIGKVNVGNNVFIAPNSVVIKDVPDNCVLSGVPAKIIKKDGVKV